MKRYSIKVNGRLFDVEVEEVTGEKAETAATSVDVAQSSGKSESDAVQSGSSEEQNTAEKETAAAVHRARTPKTPKIKEEPVRIPEGVSSQEDSLTSPMPGTVLKICVSPGDEVYAGETLIILEAMKMENEILAPRDGTVAQVVTTKGAVVDTGAPLVVLA